jgi:hypothetical protein
LKKKVSIQYDFQNVEEHSKKVWIPKVQRSLGFKPLYSLMVVMIATFKALEANLVNSSYQALQRWLGHRTRVVRRDNRERREKGEERGV